jgi:hypothetical protein
MARDAGILYADISGSTRLYRTLGTDEAKRQLERCIKRMERSVEGCKGKIVAPTGDEIVAIFPSADDMIAAAIDMQHRIADLPPVSGVRLTIRIGAHFGSIEETPEGVSGPGTEFGRALLNLAGAGQIVTCEQTAASLPPSQQEGLVPLAGMVLSTPLGDTQVLEVKERDGGSPYALGSTATMTTASSQPPRFPERLIIRAYGTAYVVDNVAPRISFGRDRASTHVLHGSKASRHHAIIEKRGRTGFVLIDQSTNGTYLKVEGNNELRLLDGEAIVTGHGKIGFGHSTTTEGDVVDFEIT